MAWFKVDDGLHSSRKFLSIPKRQRFAALGVWTVAGSWCADELTDGHVPNFMLEVWGVPPSAPAALVEAGLWERESDGYLFCNWLEYQPRKADVDAEREASRARMRELRARRKQGQPQEHAEEPEVFGRTGANGSENVRNPDPTRPDPTHTPLPTEEGGGPASPTCSRHPHWDHDQPCRACAVDRAAYEEQHEREKAALAADARRAARREPQFCEHGLPRYEACEKCGDKWPGQ